MAVRFIRNAQQLKILDAADDAVASIRSPGFDDYRPAFAKVRFDLDGFTKDLEGAARRARDAYIERGSLDNEFQRESADVQRALAQLEAWVRTAQVGARALAMKADRRLVDIETALYVGAFEGGSVENVYGDAPMMLRNLRRLGDLSDVGIDADFLDEAAGLIDLLELERQEVSSKRRERVQATAVLNGLLDRVVDLMETYARFQAFAEARSDVVIPGLGLAAIRASLAARRPDEVEIDDPEDGGDDEPL